MKFQVKDQSNNNNIIKVIGVGGGGSNAVNYMYQLGIKGVDFLVCNTDKQALDISPVPHKIQLGSSLTNGRGAGSIPDVGRNAAIENIDDIKTILDEETRMVFVTAGMGGGTGTGAAPIIAKVAREMGILTVGIVTIPFGFEGKKRKLQAEKGIEDMREAVDTLLIINNDKLREMYGNLSLANAFGHADNVLSSAAKGIAEIISVTGFINVDFNDVNTVMKDSGVAIMGTATAEGENRAMEAVEAALASPLLNDNNIQGAKHILLNITYGNKEVLMDEISDITEFIQEEAGYDADVIWGHGFDETLGEAISVTLIATGFNSNLSTGLPEEEPEKKYINLEDVSTQISSPISNPLDSLVSSNEVVNDKLEEEPFLIKKEVEEENHTQQTIFDIEEEKKNLEVENNTFTFEDINKVEENKEEESQAEVKRYYLEDDIVEENTEDNTQNSWNSEISKAEKQKLAEDRINRIKEMNMRLKTANGVSDLESEPAYKRRNVNLDDVQHSSESSVSKFTLSEEENEDGTKRTELKSNNSFLHDNVD